MIRRIAYLALAAFILLGATACGKKEEKKPEEDLQMSATPLVQPALDGEQAG